MFTRISDKRIVSPFFVGCLGCFIALLYFRDFIGIGVPAVAFLGLTCMVAVFCDKTELITFCFCCIPALNAFQSKYALFICMIMYIVRFARGKTAVLHLIPVSFLVCWELLHLTDEGFPVLDLVRLFTELIFCCFIICLPKDAFDLKKIVKSMSVMAVCVSVILLLSQLKENGFRIDILFSGVFRLGYGVDETKMSVGFNPNYLAYIYLCCMGGIFLLIYKKQHSVIDIVSIVMLCVFGLLTMSKKFILCALIILLLFMISRRKKMKILLSSIVIIAVILLVFQTVFPTAYEALMGRFEASDLSTGRNDIFSYFNEQLRTDTKLLFFGVGLFGYKDTVIAKYGFSIPHNGLQELLVMWGIPGLLAFLAFAFLAFDRAKKLNKNMTFINYLPLVIMIINIMMSQMMSSSLVTVLIAFVYVCLVADMSLDNNRMEAGTLEMEERK